MTSGGKRYPEKADRGTDRTGGCPRDLIARVSLMPMPAANATVPSTAVHTRSGTSTGREGGAGGGGDGELWVDGLVWLCVVELGVATRPALPPVQAAPASR